MVVALVSNVGLGVRAWDTGGGAEVSLGLSVLGSSKEEGVGAYYNILIRLELERESVAQSEYKLNERKRTSGGEEDELIKSEALSAGLDDSGSGSLSESEGGHGQLGDLEEADVVGDGSDHDGNAVLLLAEVLNEAGERQRGSVDLGSDQSSHHSLCES